MELRLSAKSISKLFIKNKNNSIYKFERQDNLKINSIILSDIEIKKCEIK